MLNNGWRLRVKSHRWGILPRKITLVPGLPWFDYYSQDKAAIDGAERLGKLKSVKQIKPKKGENFLSDPNVGEPKVVTLGKKVVSAGSW